MYNKKLVLANGKQFHGKGFGNDNARIGMIIYHTAMVGYQEVISDATMCDSIVLMGYPLIGNYGLTDEDYESRNISTAGLIVREYNEIPSNFRYTKTLKEVMEEYKVVGISELDTRELAKIIRNEGSMLGLICDINKPFDECMKEINEYVFPNYLSKVSSKKIWYSRTRNPLFNVVVVDCGVKLSLIKRLNQIGCNVIVVPYNTTSENIMILKPSGVIISSGPGNPNEAFEVIKLAESLISKVPMLGIALGAQIGTLAMGGEVNKMLLGHNGGNHPCRNLVTNRVNIVNQGHMYDIDQNSIGKTGLQITHIDITDRTILGLKDKDKKVILCQFHPDGNLEDSDGILNEFIGFMNEGEGRKNA